MKISGIVRGILLAAILAGSASAGDIFYGTFGFAPFVGGPTYVGTSLDQATSVTLPSTCTAFTVFTGNCEAISNVPAVYGSGIPNEFYSGPYAIAPDSAAIVFSTYTFDLSTLGATSDFASFGDTLLGGLGGGTGPVDRYTFDLDNLVVYRGTPNALTLNFIGTISDSGTSGLSGTSADILMTFNQSNGTGAVSFSGTFDTPLNLPNETPEPMTYGLVGAGLIGVGFVRRKKV